MDKVVDMKPNEKVRIFSKCIHFNCAYLNDLDIHFLQKQIYYKAILQQISHCTKSRIIFPYISLNMNHTENVWNKNFRL
jgi:hypothetical protein